MQITLKNLSLFILLAFFSLNSSANTAEIGIGSTEVQMDTDSQRVTGLVANSSEFRRSIKVGRSVAGQSARDLKWAQEFEELMSSTKEVDYLEEALKL